MPARLLRRTLLLLAALALFAVASHRGNDATAADPSQPDPAARQGPSPESALTWDQGIGKGDGGPLELRLFFSEEALRILPVGPPEKAWEWALTLARFGNSQATLPAGRAWLTVEENRAEYLRGRLIERFLKTPRGIEHTLEIPEETGAEILHFDFAVSGTLAMKVGEDGSRVAYHGPGGAALLLERDLTAVDARGREVAVRWEKLEHGVESEVVLRLIVHAADHAFPLSVSSRLTTPRGDRRPGTGAPAALETGTLAVPANDTCAGAETIPGAGPFPHLSSIIDLTDATTAGDPPPPSCQTLISRSVWFAFTPADAASYTFSLCTDAPTATTVEDTVLVVYSASGSCAGLVEMAGGCSDDACGSTGLQSALSEVPLAAGTTYYIVAWSYGTAPPPPGSESVQLRVVKHAPTGPPPPNDQCGGAEPIPAAGPFPYLTAITPDISGATATGDPPPPSCQANVSRSIWYAFTPAAGGRYTFSACADSPTSSTVDDTVLAVYAAASPCSGLTQLPGGCDDDSCAGEVAQSRISGIDLAAGTTYYIVVWSYSPEPPLPGNTAIQLRVTLQTSPSNDTCAAAQTLALDTPTAGTTVSAVDDTRLPAASPCFTGIGHTASTVPGGDVAYRFTAAQAGTYSFRLSGYDTAKNAVLYLSSDCPAGAPPAQIAGCLVAANRSAVGPEEVSCLPLAAGQSVYVTVDEHASSTGSTFVLEANRCTPEREPNGTPPTAGELTCGVNGSVTPAGEADFFALGKPEAGARAFALLDGAAANTTDFDMRLTTAADTLEYDDLNNDVPFGSVAPNLSGAPLDGAPAYLRVTHYSPAAQAEPYRLYAWVQPAPASASSEVEPNDTPATATSASNEYYSGTIAYAGDLDIFAIAAVAGESLQIGLDLNPGRDNTPFNGSLSLLDATGAVLVQVNDPSTSSSTASGAGSLASTTPQSPAEALAYRVRTTGMLYARVAASSGAPGDYLLSIAHGCRVGPATDVAVTQSDAPDPVSPGGSIAYSLLVRNLGAHLATVVTLRDDLPAGAVLITAVPSQGLCVAGPSLVCHLGTIPASGSATVSITVTAPAAPGLLTNTARVATAVIDPLAANDSSIETSTVGTDADGDGVADPADCAPGNPSVWQPPGEAVGLFFPTAADTSLLQWSPPAAPGGTQVSYDLLRSPTVAGFAAPTCLASGVATTGANDAAIPTTIFYYLVRSVNPCGSNLGSRSDGIPRAAGPCQ